MSDERTICTPDKPWDGKTTPVAHLTAVCTGSTSDGGGDYFECRVCKAKWVDHYDDN
mgnify:CR=1 FL=1